jgi:hypothetical protein
MVARNRWRWSCARTAYALGLAALLLCVVARAAAQPASGDKPNILVIFGADIGISNISAYSDGLMGYTTPNEDLQPVSGPLRARRHHVEHILGLAAQPPWTNLRCDGRDREVRRDV